MHLQLYSGDTTNFDWNGEPLRNVFDRRIYRDDTFYLEFKMTLDPDEQYKSVKRGMIIKAMTPDGPNGFRIWDVDKHNDHIKVTALSLIYDLDKVYIGALHGTNTSLSGLVATFQNYIRHTPFTISSSIDERRTFNTKEDEQTQLFNALDILMDGAHSLVGTWECELLINFFDIRLVPKLGRRTQALLHEKKNISEFEDAESDRSLVTRIKAFSTFTPEREDSSDEEPQEIRLSATIDSPLIGEYVMVYEKVYVNNNCKTEDELIKWAERKFKYEKIDLPARTIKIKTNVIDNTLINYGDTVTLKYSRHDIDDEIRCVGYVFDPVDEIWVECLLGSSVSSISNSINGVVQNLTENQLNNAEKALAEKITNIIMASNGFNRIAYGPSPVPNPIKGDLWYEFQFDRPKEITLKIYDGEKWIILVDDFTGARVNELIQKTEAKVQAMEEEFAKIQERNDAELEAFRKELESMELSEEQIESIASKINLNTLDFDELKAQIEAVRETSRVNAEMIGNDGVTRYNKNLLMGEFDRKILFTDDHITIEANDGGFKRGETYTVSFEAICELLAKANVSFNFDKETVRRLLITMTPDFEKLPIVESNGEKVQAHLGEYAVKLVSDWYQTQTSRLNVTGDSTVDVNLEYREIADGNLEMTIQGEWAEAPEIILDGGGG